MSTENWYQTSTQSMADAQSRLDGLMKKMASGKSLLNASDDPIAASRLMMSKSALAANQQFQKGQNYAQEQLSLSESTLGAVTDDLQATRELLVSTGNGVLTDADRHSYAIEIRHHLDNLVAMANSRDGSGRYLFGGYQDDQAPYTANRDANGLVTSVSYNGGSDATYHEVQDGQQIQVRQPGDRIFQVAGGQDMFQILTDFANQLDQPQVTNADRAAFSATQASTLKNLDQALDQVLAGRTQMGLSMQELDLSDQVLQAQAEQFSTSIGKMEDLDYAAASVDFAKYQAGLQAAHTTFAKISQLSIFDVLR